MTLVQEGQGGNTELLIRKKHQELEQLRLKYFFLLYFEAELQLFIFGKDTQLICGKNLSLSPDPPSPLLIQ